MNNKLFISGKVSGDPDHAAKFRAAQFHALTDDFFDRHADARIVYRHKVFRFRIINPLQHCKKEWSWPRCMAKCLRLLMGCSYVYMLGDWRESRGARIEHAVARITRKHIIYQSEEDLAHYDRPKSTTQQ